MVMDDYTRFLSCLALGIVVGLALCLGYLVWRLF